jgi:hypothetical protein
MSGHYGFERGSELCHDEPTFTPAELAKVHFKRLEVQTSPGLLPEAA